MSWDQYAQILRENQDPDFLGIEEERQTCPNDGTTLQESLSGVVFCPFGCGYRRDQE